MLTNSKRVGEGVGMLGEVERDDDHDLFQFSLKKKDFVLAWFLSMEIIGSGAQIRVNRGQIMQFLFKFLFDWKKQKYYSRN